MDAAEGRTGGGLSWGAVALLLGFAAFALLPIPLLDKFYLVGFGICPQRPTHSYFLGGGLVPGETSLRAALPAINQVAPSEQTKMPVEARMYGIFAGFLVTWLYAFFRGRGRAALMPKPLILFVYVSFIVVMGLDGINATLRDIHVAGLPIPYAYEPRLDVRFITGWLSGIGMAGIILPVVNYSLWKYAKAVPMFDNLRQILPLLALGVVILGLMTIGSGLFYYPLAVLAPLGIAAIFAALNIVVVVALMGRDRVAANWVEALNPLALSLLLAFIELGALSLVRYAVFGFGAIA